MGSLFVDVLSAARLVGITMAVMVTMALLGCGSRHNKVLVAWAEPINGPDGTEHYLVECIRRRTHCVRQAGKSCPHGYRVVERDGDSTSEFVSDTSTMAFGNGARSRTSTRESRDYQGSMLIKCAAPRATPLAAAPAPATPAASAPDTSVDGGIEEMANPYPSRR